MANNQAAAGIPRAELELWDFALQNMRNRGLPTREEDYKAIVGNRTIDDLVRMTPQDRLKLINKFWDAIVEWQMPNTTIGEMFEPPTNDRWSKQSSEAGTAWAFRKHGIGFHCETADQLERILNEGPSPLYSKPDIAEHVGHRIRGTVMMTRSAAGQIALWKQNRDVVGETGVCVSRGIKGATKFPRCDYRGQVCLFALKLTGLLGVDTEKWQRGKLDKTAVWRPGEKVYGAIPRPRVIGCVRVNRLVFSNNSWKINVIDQTWRSLSASPEDQAYLQRELDRLTPGLELDIPAAQYDFWR
jgi:hypothetical protein